MNPNPDEGKVSFLCARFLLPFYRAYNHETFRAPLRRLVLKLEGGEMYSRTIRDIFRTCHEVDIGLYTLGATKMRPGLLSRGTTVGRFSSIYPTTRTFNHNHPMNTKSTHGVFYEPGLGLVPSDMIKRISLRIGHDVWTGHNSIILNTVESIGDGAVIGAGAVVSSNVPPYAIVTGYPARVVRYRFSEKKIQELLAEQWWNLGLGQLRERVAEFRSPLEETAPVR